MVDAKLEIVVVETVCFVCWAWIWYDFSATLPKNLPLIPSKTKYAGTPNKLYNKVNLFCLDLACLITYNVRTTEKSFCGIKGFQENLATEENNTVH